MVVAAAVAVAGEPVAALNALEADNDRVEAAFDGFCSALKAGRRDGPLPVTDLAWVTACSLRALRLEPVVDGGQRAHVLWDVEGRRGSGERASLRGEADVVLRRGGQVRFTAWADTWREAVSRSSPRFVERAEEAGLTTSPAPRPSQPVAELLAGGLSVHDVTGDGVPEVFTVDGHEVLRFDRTSSAPLTYARSTVYRFPRSVLATAVLGGDFDRDGDTDLLLTGYPSVAPVVLRNDGARFSPLPLPVTVRGNFVSAVPSDLDGDGDLDVALLDYDLGAGFPFDMLEALNGERPTLVRGGPGASFTPWRLPRAQLTPRWTLAGVASDLLNLGSPQLYLANDFGSNDLYVFLPDGGVHNAATERGLDDPGNGMSADVGDFDGDGALDLSVANMFSKAGTRIISAARVQAPLKARLEKFARGNTLYLSRDGGFDEVAVARGVNRGLWAFATLLTDVDDDGRLDVAVANGYLSNPDRRDL